MKTFVYLLAGIGLVAFGVHSYNDAGTIAMAPTPVVAEYRIAVAPEGWLAEPVAPASSSPESGSRPAIVAPEPTSRAAEVVRPVAAAPRANVYASTSWDQPARVQTIIHESEERTVHYSFVGVILLLGILLIFFVIVRSILRGKALGPSDDTALIHELARRAQDLSQRMEALETILLDRTRATR
jgi:hypothetical protein